MVKPKLLDQVRAAMRVRHPRLYVKQEGFPTLREVVSRSSIRKQCNK